MKFYPNYFGCRTNQAEIQEWIIELENSGYRLSSNLSDADFGILNTCSVTERAEKDVLRFLKKVYKKTNDKWIITGCTVSKEKKALQNKYKNYFFLNNTDKEHLVNSIKKIFPINKNIIYHSSFRSRIFLKIQDGCNNYCSFCKIPLARGKERSKKPEEIIDDISSFIKNGYEEVVLTGINLGSYNYNETTFYKLLQIIYEYFPDIRFRISSIEPQYIDNKFLKTFNLLL